MTDVVIVRANNQAKIYPGLEEKGWTGCEPPFWGALLAGYLRAKGFEAELLDAQVEGWTYEETAQHINDRQAHLCVIAVSGTNPNASTQNMVGVVHLSPLINAPVALHGLHPSALPLDCLEINGVDYAIKGEGFNGIEEYLRGKKYPAGFISKENLNPVAPTLVDPKDLPRPAWDLLPVDKYRAHLCMCFGGRARSPYAVVYTSLGCPYRCKFCTINSLFYEPEEIHRKVRYREIDQVVDEIRWLNETYGVVNIKIMDEMFALNKSRVITLCDKIASLKLNLNMRAYARVDTVDEEMLVAMKRAGINWIGYGFESGNEHVLDVAKKGKILQKMYQAVELTHRIGIQIDANYMFGMEEDTDETHRETFKLMLDLNCAWANINTCMPYPGSLLYHDACRSGWEPPLSYTGYAQHTPDSHPLRGSWAVAWRDWAFTAYHRNPAYLAQIENLFGEETRKFMENLTETRLERDHHGL